MTMKTEQKGWRLKAQNPQAMALSFEHLAEVKWVVNEVRWSAAAFSELVRLADDLGHKSKQKKAIPGELPYKPLRLLVQVYDRNIVRVAERLALPEAQTSTLFTKERNSGLLLLTRSSKAEAIAYANQAIAWWAEQVLLKDARLPKSTVEALADLALEQKAIEVKEQQAAVFAWEQGAQGSARPPKGLPLYRDLADYVATLLTGQEVFEGQGPLRRIVSNDLESNSAELLTLPKPALIGKDSALFSLGVVISVETLPGRPLPLIQLHFKKYLWAAAPTRGMRALSGYVFPQSEARVLKFGVKADLELEQDYKALATAPAMRGLVMVDSARELAQRGPLFGGHQVVITHIHGRNQAASVPAGVPDIDRQLAFEKIADLLSDFHFTPWGGIEEVPTPFKPLTDLDAPWREQFKEQNAIKIKQVAAFAEPSLFGEAGGSPQKKVKKEKTAKQLAKEQDAKALELTEWFNQMSANIEAHYSGTHRVLLAYQEDLERDAQQASNILKTVLGENAEIIARVLPEGVHGPITDEYKQENGKRKKATDRANIRATKWLPIIEWVQKYRKEHPEVSFDGMLVLAKDRYGIDSKPDDVINKQVGRITLKRELGLTVQYLLPRNLNLTDSDGEFQMRVVNAWRDLAWKSLGKFNHLTEQMQDLHLMPQPSAVLGVGILRLNKTKTRSNKHSFIPYAIELDVQTGTCSGTVLLSEDEKAGPFIPLSSLVQTIAKHGPSRLEGKNPERARKVQEFIYDVVSQRTNIHKDMVVLFQQPELRGMWSHLTDENLTADDISLAGADGVEFDFAGAALVRVRPDHAPKVTVETPDVRLLIDGVERFSAKWSDTILYRVNDASQVMPTYFSFASKLFKPPRGASCFRQLTQMQVKGSRKGEREVNQPFTGYWGTPTAVEFTLIRPGAYHPDALAQFCMALRHDAAHVGSWLQMPGPLHFASFLKEYIPDYELVELEQDDEGEEQEPMQPSLFGRIGI